jgi:hypothetical protein
VPSQKPSVGFDSNVLSLFVDVSDGKYTAPATDPNRFDMLAAFWLFLFCDASVLPVVSGETQAIRDQERLTAHLRAIGVNFGEASFYDHQLSDIQRRASELLPLHPKGVNDCLLVAESEAWELPILVTRDRTFRKRLTGHTRNLQLLSPIACCKLLGIPDSEKSHWNPAASNPLSNESWWRWGNEWQWPAGLE